MEAVEAVEAVEAAEAVEAGGRRACASRASPAPALGRVAAALNRRAAPAG